MAHWETDPGVCRQASPRLLRAALILHLVGEHVMVGVLQSPGRTLGEQASKCAFVKCAFV